MISITNLLILVTVVISIYALGNEGVMYKWMMNPYSIHKRKEYYRFLTSGFIHADYMHLLFNMFTFYYFGNMVERNFNSLSGNLGGIYFIILYVAGIVISDLPTYFKNKYNSTYNSLGASGGVSSILFAGILFNPMAELGFLFIPIGIPAFLYGIIYLVYTYTQSKRGRDGINHDAHLYGALFGLVFTILLYPPVLSHFIIRLGDLIHF